MCLCVCVGGGGGWGGGGVGVEGGSQYVFETAGKLSIFPPYFCNLHFCGDMICFLVHEDKWKD